VLIGHLGHELDPDWLTGIALYSKAAIVRVEAHPGGRELNHDAASARAVLFERRDEVVEPAPYVYMAPRTAPASASSTTGVVCIGRNSDHSAIHS
jgi:hypothetical protein